MGCELRGLSVSPPLQRLGKSPRGGRSPEAPLRTYESPAGSGGETTFRCRRSPGSAPLPTRTSVLFSDVCGTPWPMAGARGPSTLRIDAEIPCLSMATPLLSRIASSLSRGASFLSRGASFLSRRASSLSRRASFLSKGASFLSRRASSLSRGASFINRAASCPEKAVPFASVSSIDYLQDGIRTVETTPSCPGAGRGAGARPRALRRRRSRVAPAGTGHAEGPREDGAAGGREPC
jgi:hypothetical protein